MLSTYSAYGLLEAMQEVLNQTGIPLDLRGRTLQKKREERLILEDQMRRCF